MNRTIRRLIPSLCLLSSIFVASSTHAQQGNDVLIPREKLFGNPEKVGPQVSPDGKFLAFRAPRDGVMNVWVAPIDDLQSAAPVTNDRTSGISQYFWAHTNQHILFLQDDNGDEDFHLYSTTLDGKTVVDLTPLKKIRAQVIGVSEKFPDTVLVGINDRDQHYLHDVYRINITSGERKLIVENPGFAGFLPDHDYNVRLAFAFTPKGGLDIFTADPKAEKGWSPLFSIAAEDSLTTQPAGFDKSGELLYLLDSRERDTTAFKTLNMKTGELKEVFASKLADVDNVITHPTEHHAQAVGYTYDRPKWEILDESIREDFDYLSKLVRGDFIILSRTQKDDLWTVAYDADNGPVKFYLYDRPNKTAKFLFSHRPELEELPLAKMRSEVIESRDGLKLVSYLTLPNGSDSDEDGRPAAKLPMVLLVHGGPWARDSWGFDPLHQLLANRGYAVLSVNYRGSTGFGKSFINAANGEWAAKMHDDLVDAVNWAVDEGIADPAKVAIMGGSYGGYATLVGLTFTPELFACGVDIVGPSSLISLLENPPPYWMPVMSMMKHRVGDWESDEGREFLKSRSPLFKAAEIKRPLLIGQGAKDPRVKQTESDQIVKALQEKNIPVTYMLYPEEGHGFDRPENKLAFFAVTEAFLANQLGGKCEPIGYAFKGANFQIPAGADHVPAIQASMKTEKAK